MCFSVPVIAGAPIGQSRQSGASSIKSEFDLKHFLKNGMEN
jgi:hypothetical protein